MLADALLDLNQCATCGVERDDASEPCPICEDERQYQPPGGQAWTTPRRQALDGARLTLSELEPGLYGVDLLGGAGIGQQAKLAITGSGNLLFEVPAFIDQAAVDAVAALGGIDAIVTSHPHMYGVQSAWSAAFGDAPVWAGAPDASWLGRRFPALRLWDGDAEPLPGVRLSQPGGHFPGSAVAWIPGSDGAGVLLSGDTLAAVPDAGWVTFMRSYPNKIPLSPAVVERIAAHLDARYRFERLYDNFTGRVASDAAARVQESARRYAGWARGDFDHLTGPG